MGAKETQVYHIPGRFIAGERMEDHKVESVERANELVATGAFALSEREANAAAYSTPEVTPATDDNVKQPTYPRTVGAGFGAVTIEKAAEEPANEAPAAPAAAEE